MAAERKSDRHPMRRAGLPARVFQSMAGRSFNAAAERNKHSRIKSRESFVQNNFSFGRVRFVNANARYHTALASLELMITLWHNSHPFHREFLNGEEQPSEIASLNFHIM
jgi:hypothetical protein